MYPPSLTLEQAILQLAAGTPLQAVEQRYGLEGCMLLPAAEAYRSAGLQALESLTGSRWHYWRLPLAVLPGRQPTQVADEIIATCVGPVCEQLVASHAITCWWFLRKSDQEPHIRLRVLGVEPQLSKEGVTGIEKQLLHLREVGRLQPWTTLIYEPETMLFGGPAGIEHTHHLFYQDSEALYQWLSMEQVEEHIQRHRSTVSLLLIQRLLHGAALDSFEQWDVWTRVRQLRPGKVNVAEAGLLKNKASFMRLLATSDDQLQAIFGKVLYTLISSWGEHFEDAGRELAQLHRSGQLQCGLRQILAAHIVFHWNRFGFSAGRQIQLAHLAERIAAG